MALTITEVADSQDVFGKTPCSVFDLTPDSSFPVGGYGVTAASFGMGGAIIGIEFIGQNTGALGKVPVWDQTVQKITGFTSSTGSELTGSQTTVTWRARVSCSRS